jgi:hypothetical protein
VRVFCALAFLLTSSATQADGLGRCVPFDGSYTIAAGESAPAIVPYLECLAGADRRNGFNDGPYAISLCTAERATVIEGTLRGDRENIEFLLKQIERELVWLIWCDTDVGSELPADIEIRSEWPQGGARGWRND